MGTFESVAEVVLLVAMLLGALVLDASSWRSRKPDRASLGSPVRRRPSHVPR